MEIMICRTYFSDGVNGQLYINGSFLCYTIELPWLDNKPMLSCIPEGRYELKKRWSPHFAFHLQVVNVPGRTLILVHPANNARKELKGCIAPVSLLSAPGVGSQSRKAFNKLMNSIAVLTRNESIFITIKKRSL